MYKPVLDKNTIKLYFCAVNTNDESKISRKTEYILFRLFLFLK